MHGKLQNKYTESMVFNYYFRNLNPMESKHFIKEVLLQQQQQWLDIILGLSQIITLTIIYQNIVLNNKNSKQLQEEHL